MEKIEAFYVVEQLEITLTSMNILPELNILRIPRYRIFKKNKFINEYKALMIFLWNLTIKKHYPNDYKTLFYLAQIYPMTKYIKKYFNNENLFRLFKQYTKYQNEKYDFSTISELIIGGFMKATFNDLLEKETKQLTKRINGFYERFNQYFKKTEVINTQEDYNYYSVRAIKLATIN